MKRLFLLLIVALLSCQLPAQEVNNNSVDTIFHEWNQPGVPGGSVAVIKNGQIAFSKGYGMADLEHDIAITPATVFYIGSISKQFVTFSMLLLKEQGLLHLDDEVQKYLPDFPRYDAPLTIRHLIHHTGGVKDYFPLLFLNGRSYLDHIERQEVYDLIKNQKELNFTPGKQFLYSNSGYLILAMIIEKVSGMSLKEFARREIFIPLNMGNSQFYDDIADLENIRALSYSKNGENFEALVLRSTLVGGGGVYSTVEDLYKWDQNFYENTLGQRRQSIIDTMHQVGLLNDGKSSGYAFALVNGMYKGLRTVSHGGALAGYRSYYVRFPYQEVSIILLSNRDDAAVQSKAYELAELYLIDHLRESP